MNNIFPAASAVFLIGSASCEARAQCDAHWLAGHAVSDLSGQAFAVTTWDEDGPGPQSPLLVAGGQFTTAGTTTVNNIGRWDGSSWSAMASGLPGGQVHALTVFNGQPVAGGIFPASGQPTYCTARWNGSGWDALDGGTFTNGLVRALAVYHDELIAAGDFTIIGGVSARRIARWNGSIWQDVGGGFNNAVFALTVANGELVAGGNLGMASGVTTHSIARWNGAVWMPVGNGFSTTVTSLAPFNGQLFAGGQFSSSATGQPLSHIARWDGSAWHALGTGLTTGSFLNVYSMTAYNGRLIVGGTFGTAGGVTVNHIAQWDGTTWAALSSGMNASVLALTAHDGMLVAGGYFQTAGSESSRYFARWTSPLLITSQPTTATVCPSDSAIFSVAAVEMPAATFRWRKGALVLANGPTGSGSQISGAASSMLTIANVSAADAGSYSCFVMTGCNSALSDAVPLLIGQQGDSDGDGAVGISDIATMIQHWATSVTPFTLGDLNGNGKVGLDDISIAISQWGATCQ